MNDVVKWLEKQSKPKANAHEQHRRRILSHTEGAFMQCEAIVPGDISETNGSINEPKELPTPLKLPQVHELTLGNALAQETKQSDANKKDNLAALNGAQDNFALFSGPVLSIVDKDAVKGGSLTLIQLASGKLLIKRFLSDKFEGVDQNAVLNQFLVDSKTTIYKGVDFCPMGGKVGHLNLWVDPTLKPAEGDWDNVKDFLQNIICSGNTAVYVYLTSYLAHALQKPQQKPGVLLSLLGGQGIGKGTLMKIIMLIWGATTYKTNRIEDVIGNFNAAVEGKLWILLDEAQFAGDAKATTALKSFTTESTVSINGKFQAQRMIPSLHRIVCCTNQISSGYRDSDDRRDLALRVSEKHKGDHAYWEKLNNCLEQEVAAMMHELLQMDIGLFNIYDKPNTEELTTQKINSLNLEEAWWLNILRDGILIIGSGGGWGRFVKTKDIAYRITEYRSELGHRKSYLDPNTQAHNLMAKWCRSAVKSRSPDATRHRGYQLPTLEEARQDFEATLGGKVGWEE